MIARVLSRDGTETRLRLLFCKLDHEENHVPKAKTNTKKTAGKPKKKDAGAKLTKAFRNFGPIKELMNSNLGREVLADVLIAAAGAAAAALTKKRGAKADAAREAVHTAAGAVAGVVTDAARHFLPASLLAEDEPAPALRSKPAGSPPVRKVKVTVASAKPKKRKASVRKSVAASAASPKIAET
jgi:hypothetical protein